MSQGIVFVTPLVEMNITKPSCVLSDEWYFFQTYADPNRQLELRYRPKDPFCHSLCGNRFPSNNLLLRVRRRVRKKDPQDTQLHMEVLGVIGTTYKFQGNSTYNSRQFHLINTSSSSSGCSTLDFSIHFHVVYSSS